MKIIRRLEARWRGWALRHLPAGFVTHGMEGFVGILCLVSGGGILSRISEPRAAEQFLDDPVYALWGGSLLIGGLALLIGVTSIRWVRIPIVYLIRRAEFYRLGLRLLAASTGLYGIAQIYYGGFDAVPAALLTLYFTFACTARLLAVGPNEEEAA